ncbi:MAG: hypothetical protein F6J93_14075 [Oscillatoria sp. SIO1A7]|nr:hypothetical protein [Oscillatoria sp. SIO1A7]
MTYYLETYYLETPPTPYTPHPTPPTTHTLGPKLCLIALAGSIIEW